MIEAEEIGFEYAALLVGLHRTISLSNVKVTKITNPNLEKIFMS